MAKININFTFMHVVVYLFVIPLWIDKRLPMFYAIRAFGLQAPLPNQFKLNGKNGGPDIMTWNDA